MKATSRWSASCGWPGGPSRTGRTRSRSATPPGWPRHGGSGNWSASSASVYPEVPLNLHFHNTRGTGLANVLEALELGVSDFDASVGGLGGCPYAPGATGNIATEELVHMVEDMGVATGIDLDAMIEAAADAERIIGRQLPSQVLRAGPRTRTIPATCT